MHDLLDNPNTVKWDPDYKKCKMCSLKSECLPVIKRTSKVRKYIDDVFGWYEMRKLLNTLYVTNPNSYLARDGETILIRVDDEVKFRIPAINLESIVCFGYQGASPPL
jgi:hypothetical protein